MSFPGTGALLLTLCGLDFDHSLEKTWRVEPGGESHERKMWQTLRCGSLEGEEWKCRTESPLSIRMFHTECTDLMAGFSGLEILFRGETFTLATFARR